MIINPLWSPPSSWMTRTRFVSVNNAPLLLPDCLRLESNALLWFMVIVELGENIMVEGKIIHREKRKKQEKESHDLSDMLVADSYPVIWVNRGLQSVPVPYSHPSIDSHSIRRVWKLCNHIFDVSMKTFPFALFYPYNNTTASIHYNSSFYLPIKNKPGIVFNYMKSNNSQHIDSVPRIRG